MIPVNLEQLENFETAFHNMVAGSVRTCDCGKVFYNPTGGWDWEDGELEALDKSESATGVDWTVQTIWIQGKEYCNDCDCWHKPATQVFDWIIKNRHAVTELLNLEKKRLESEAMDTPVPESMAS